MSYDKDLYDKAVQILENQLFAVLATSGENGPHSVIVSFVSADHINDIIFVTPRQTRKFKNLLKNNVASIFMDNRSNEISDLQRTIGIEAMGEVEEISELDRERFIQLYTAKYPEMEDFILAPTSALMRMKVNRYEIVHNFQNVTILEIP